MEAKGEKHIRIFLFVCFALFVCLCFFPLVCSLKSTGTAATTIMSEDGSEKREDEIFSAHREGTNGIKCGQHTHFRIII